MTDQALAITGLVFVTAVCCGALGFGLGRFSVRTRSRVSPGHSEAVLASALEDGLARLKAQQKAMSDRAVASERLSAQIVESLAAGLLLVDGAGRVELLNPAGQRLLGLTDLVTEQPFEVALQSAAALIALVEEGRSSRQPAARRMVTIPGSTGPLHLGVTISPIDRGEGSGGVICLFSDLTSVVEMEDELRLKDALARLGELTAGLAHEFRNGLATIHGYARLLDPALLPERYGTYVESLRAETDQLGRVVTNFLNFARPAPLTCVRVSLGDIVSRAVDEIRRDLPAGGVLSVTGQFGALEGDEQLLKQAFDNLLRNALQACAGAGVVPSIQVCGDVDSSQRLSHVYVDDNGPGIPESERARIFQPFFTTRAAGTGLGLSIVQRIVLAHNGRITAASSPNGGARFELTFPGPPAAHRDSELNTAA